MVSLVKQNAWFRSTGDTFIKLATGELNPMIAILTGKVKISNQGEMLRYAKYLG